MKLLEGPMCWAEVVRDYQMHWIRSQVSNQTLNQKVKGGKDMEIRISVDNNKLKEFGLSGIAEEVVKSLKHFPFLHRDIVFNRMISGMGLKREAKPEVKSKEIKAVEKKVLVDLKKDVKKVLEKKTKKDLVEFVLNKLDGMGLGKLIQK